MTRPRSSSIDFTTSYC